jgi:hypothetical protein
MVAVNNDGRVVRIDNDGHLYTVGLDVLL